MEKPTKGNLEHKIKSAIVFVEKDKDTKSVYFDDKGLRLTITSDFVVVSTGFHRHVFNNVTSAGVSRPYLYVKRFIDMALENDCVVKDAKGNVTRSYVKLMDILKNKENKSDYNIAWFVDLWLFNIFAPLFTIGESESEAFLVYEDYLHNIARQQSILSEKDKDVTNKAFVDIVMENMKKFTEGMEERVIFKKKTDKELQEENAQALAEHENDKAMEEQANG